MANKDNAFEPSHDVVIIGAGFSGSLTAIHLLSAPGEDQPPASVALVEKETAAFGRGVAYSTPCAAPAQRASR